MNEYTDQQPGRGAQEEASGVPYTETEAEANRRPPSRSGGSDEPVGEASGGTGGASGRPGQSDAAR